MTTERIKEVLGKYLDQFKEKLTTVSDEDLIDLVNGLCCCSSNTLRLLCEDTES